ncbi:MAG TPA: glycosyltransferase family 39 protein, partial [Thermoanaerobaculia bacterium]|nr:glycosyltransferase family 39 protein [Thermoanaerobaculia bacterium]
MAGDSATADEPVHIASAVEIVREGTGRWNVEHPPLAKALAGLALAGVPLDPAPNPFSTPNHAPLLLRFLFENRSPGETILFRARLPFVLLFALLLVALRREAHARFASETAGLFALAFAALDPNLLAHAGVVHTDLAVTLFIVLSLRPLASLPNAGERRAAILLGLFWGLAFLSKYSAPLIVAATLPLLFLEEIPRERRSLVAKRLATAAGIALLVTLAGFALAYRNQTRADFEAVANDRLVVRGGSPASFDAALAIGRVFRPAGDLAVGTLSIALQSRSGANVNYFMGKVSREGSPLYFPVALATKVSLGLLFAALLGAVSYRGRRFALAAGAGVVLFLLASLRTTYNIGVRHLLFVVPLAALVAAAAAASGEGGPRRARTALLTALLALEAIETITIHPHELSFFNVLAGGLDRGRRFFVDSNLDWGQDLARLAREAPRFSAAPIPAVVFGGDLPRRYPTLRPVAPGDEDRPGQIIGIGEAPFALGAELLARKGAAADAARLARLVEAVKTHGRRVGEI